MTEDPMYKIETSVLSRRDVFAAVALHAILRTMNQPTNPVKFEVAAGGAVHYADTLIERLDRPTQEKKS